MTNCQIFLAAGSAAFIVGFSANGFLAFVGGGWMLCGLLMDYMERRAKQ